MIKDFGNGILRFDCYGDTFGNELSRFLKEHSGLCVVSIAQDNMYEFTGNFWVIVKKVI
jgi:hypothetical protein